MPAAARYLWAWVGSTAVVAGRRRRRQSRRRSVRSVPHCRHPGIQPGSSRRPESARALFKHAGCRANAPGEPDPRQFARRDRFRSRESGVAEGCASGVQPGASWRWHRRGCRRVRRGAARRLAEAGRRWAGLSRFSRRPLIRSSTSSHRPARRRLRCRDLRRTCSALLTLNALADSLATIKAQHEPYATSLTDAGFNPKWDYVGVARREGYFAMFRQRDQENALAYVRGPKTVFQAGGRAVAGLRRGRPHHRARAHTRRRAALRASIRITRIPSCSSS